MIFVSFARSILTNKYIQKARGYIAGTAATGMIANTVIKLVKNGKVALPATKTIEHFAKVAEKLKKPFTLAAKAIGKNLPLLKSILPTKFGQQASKIFSGKSE